jgi:outer membrane protein assembly factor BamB
MVALNTSASLLPVGSNYTQVAFAQTSGGSDVLRRDLALAVGENAAVVARPAEVTAYDLKDGRVLWTHPLSNPPVPWGLALTRQGRVVATLEGGKVLCLSSADMAAAR